MGWERRQRGGRYYYRSVRVDGRPRKIYLGTGSAGEGHARQDAGDRHKRALDRSKLETEQARLTRADAALDDLKAAADLLGKAELLAAGYHEHRGQWRMCKMPRKAGKSADESKTPGEGTDPKPAGPAAGTAGGVKADGRAELTARLKALAARADAGDRQALGGLRRLLDDHPEVWEHVGDLSARAELTWIEVIAGGDRLEAESYKRKVAKMKADLNGPHPTPTEALLVEQVVSCWLALKHGEMSAALNGGSVQQAALGLRRAESTQRRYTAALKLLALLRAKLPQGLAPVNTLTLYEDKRKRA